MLIGQHVEEKRCCQLVRVWRNLANYPNSGLKKGCRACTLSKGCNVRHLLSIKFNFVWEGSMFCASAFSCYLSPQIDARPFINFFVLLTPAFSGFLIYLQTYVAMRFVFDTASGKSCLGCRIYSYSSFRLAEIAYSQVFTVYQMKLCRILGCNFSTSQTAVSFGSNVSCRK